VAIDPERETADEIVMSFDRLINMLVTVTLIEMMVLIGLRVTFAEGYY
jgi:hypothetical protein